MALIVLIKEENATLLAGDRLLCFLIDLPIVNACIMWSHNKHATDQLTFSLRLSRQLVAGFSSLNQGKDLTFSRETKGV
jgi:hypothetical protein